MIWKMKLECLTVCADLTDMSFPLSITEVCRGIMTWREIDRLVRWSMEGSRWVVYLLLIHLFLPFSFVLVSWATANFRASAKCLNSVWIIFRASTTVPSITCQRLQNVHVYCRFRFDFCVLVVPVVLEFGIIPACCGGFLHSRWESGP